MFRRIGFALTLSLLVSAAPGTARASISVTVPESHEYKRQCESYESRGESCPPIQGPLFNLRIVGGASDDEISLSLVDGAVKINGADPAGSQLMLSQVENLLVDGGTGDDSIDLSGMKGYGLLMRLAPGIPADILVGGGDGADRLVALGVNRSDQEMANSLGLGPYLRGGDGPDLVLGSPVKDLLNGGPGDDRIYGYGERDLLQGGTGVDRLWGGGGTGEKEGDSLYGGRGDDWLFGGIGDDLLLGKLGSDTLVGGPGRDTMYEKTASRRWPGGCDEAPPGLCNPIIN